jgi:hypothetical protein
MKNSKGLESLQSLKTKMYNQRKAEEKHWHDEMTKRHDELMQKRGFHTPEEMIDYLMSGKKIVDRTGQSFQFVDGAVEFIYEIYDEGAGPLGFAKKYQTLADFKKFVYGVLAKHKEQRCDKWMPIWVKDK